MVVARAQRGLLAQWEARHTDGHRFDILADNQGFRITHVHSNKRRGQIDAQELSWFVHFGLLMLRNGQNSNSLFYVSFFFLDSKGLSTSFFNNKLNNFKTSLKKQVIELARSWPLYFCRLFPVAVRLFPFSPKIPPSPKLTVLIFI